MMKVRIKMDLNEKSVLISNIHLISVLSSEEVYELIVQKFYLIGLESPKSRFHFEEIPNIHHENCVFG